MGDRRSSGSYTTRHRVGLIHWAFLPTTGGVESHLSELAQLLTQEGCSVTVITGEPSPAPTPGIDLVTSRVLSLELIRSGANRTSSYVEELRRTLLDAISDRQLDIVHGHNLHHFASEPALILDDLRRKLGFKLHHTFHETWPDILQDTPVYRSWDGNYAVSAFVQDECANRLGFRPRLLRLGVDVARFRTSRRSLEGQRVPVVLHPARLLPWKGVHISVQMLALLRSRGLQARLILTDTQRIADWNEELVPYRREIVQLVASLGLKEIVEFRPAEYSEMPALYEEADIVIYPTVGREPFGLVPLESMSCERPIVASNCGGIPETLVDGRTGYIVEPGDCEALADRVSRLLADPGLAQRLGAAGRRHVMRHFDMRQYVGTLLEFYGERVRTGA